MEICKKKECTGCALCKNICPQKCINLLYDDYGFLFPKIDDKKCIKCGLCKKQCPNNREHSKKEPLKTYAAYSEKSEIRKNSTSGGIASQVICNFIKKNGIAYCATYNDDLTVSHNRIDNINQLYKASESKYVQSNISNVYKEILKDLKSSKNVLFIGTPCQVDAINKFLNTKNDNLYTIDIICHGVASQKYLDQQLEYTNKQKYSIDKIRFRKNDYYVFELLKNNNIVFSQSDNKNFFVTGFQKSLLLRESCFFCQYKSINRCSDLTLGDFWGLKDININTDERRKGVSVLLVNNNKGYNLLNEYGQGLKIKEESLKEAVEGNKPLRSNSTIPKDFYKFRKLYIKHGYIKACKKIIKRRMILSQIKRKILNIKKINK